MVVEGVAKFIEGKPTDHPRSGFRGEWPVDCKFVSLRNQSRYHLNQCHLLNGCEGGQLPLAVETLSGDVIG